MKVVKEKHLNKHASLGWKEKRLVSATTFFFFFFSIRRAFLIVICFNQESRTREARKHK